MATGSTGPFPAVRVDLARGIPPELADGDGGGRLFTDGDGIPLRAVPAR